MRSQSPLAVRERHAAEMLDMPLTDFRRLVSQGALPGPIVIGTHERWLVEHIRATLDGRAALPNGDFEL